MRANHMQVKSRKAEQAAATRRLLVSRARKLFGARGYANVALDEIAKREGVTIGALYHHFKDKRELFRAVYEEVESELGGKIAADIAAHSGHGSDAWQEVRRGAQAFLDACLDRGVQRIALIEAPSVLGHGTGRDIARYGLALIRRGLQRSVEQGHIKPQPIEPLAHLIRSAITEGAMLLARSADKTRARAEIGAAVNDLIDGLRYAQRKRPRLGGKRSHAPDAAIISASRRSRNRRSGSEPSNSSARR
jgi:AcrR family transcriptional regulator